MAKWIKLEDTYFNLDKIEAFRIKQVHDNIYVVEMNCTSGHKAMFTYSSYKEAERFITDFILLHYPTSEKQ